MQQLLQFGLLLFLLILIQIECFNTLGPQRKNWEARASLRFRLRSTQSASQAQEGGKEPANDDEYVPPEVSRRRLAKLEKLRGSIKQVTINPVLDDFVQKRNNMGKVFYGQGLSGLTEAELKGVLKQDTSALDYEQIAFAPMKPNAVFVVGATGATGEWVVFNLLNKGFNVRVYARSLEKAEAMFGADGETIDVCLGDVKDAKRLAEAAIGCQAAVYVAGSRSLLGLLGFNSYKQVDYEGVENFAKACVEAGLSKIALLSSIGAGSYTDGRGVQGFGGGGQAGELINKLFGDPLLWKYKGEEAIRKTGIPYVIVRAAGLLNEQGNKRGIVVGQGDNFGQASLARMDAAECLVESLVADIEFTTFEVRNTKPQEGDTGLSRPTRQSYSEANPDLVEKMVATEAIATEEFWAEQFCKIAPDSS